MATLDEDEAKTLGMAHMEAHNLNSGVVTRFNRVSVDDPWVVVSACMQEIAAGQSCACAARVRPLVSGARCM